jgi:hypothetical protein
MKKQSTEIIVIGIVHFDPLGHNKLLAVMKDISSANFFPDSIAVEWDENTAKTLIESRNLFRAYMLEKDPELSEHYITAFSDALAYEADTHKEVFPDLAVLWLDEGRKIEEPMEYLKDRFAIHRYTLHFQDAKKFVSLKTLSDVSWKVALTDYGTTRDNTRDNIFYQKIVGATDGGARRIIIVVGANHANLDIRDSLASLLKCKGYKITAIILDK